MSLVKEERHRCRSLLISARVGRVGHSVLGLGRGDLSLITQLGPQINDTFSYCLVDTDSAISKASSLTFGTTDKPSARLAYTPLLRNIYRPFYYVNVIGISVAGGNLEFSEGSFDLNESGAGGTVVDSGTTYTYLNLYAFEALLEILPKLIAYPLVFSELIGFNLCYNISGVAKPTYPQVMFQLQDVNVTLPNENVFTVVDDAKETACLAFLPSIGLSVLGNIWQQNFHIEFDTAKNRLGITHMQC